MKKIANALIKKTRKYDRRKNAVNKKIINVSDRPRLIVNKSNKYNYAQIVDLNGKVLAVATDLKMKTGTKVEKAKNVGLELAKNALKNGVDTVVFDRNGYLYHGRVKSIADGAREGGLKF